MYFFNVVNFAPKRTEFLWLASSLTRLVDFAFTKLHSLPKIYIKKLAG